MEQQLQGQERYVLAVDCGTQSLRTLLFDESGRLIAKVKESYEPYYSNKAGMAEKEPDQYWQAFEQAMQKLQTVAADLFPQVIGLTIASLRASGVFLDQDGQVIRPSILFLDQREAKCEKPLPIWYQMGIKAVGMYDPVEMARRQCKTNWMQENEPDNWAETKHYLMLSGYFHYKLTGRYVDSITNQIGHIPFDFKRRRWDKKGGLHDLMFPLERDILPELVEPGEVIGELLPALCQRFGLPANLPVIAGGSDKGCETLGVGCISAKGISLSFGTVATIQTMTDKYIEPIPFLPAYPAMYPERYNPEIQIYRGYWMIRWFRQEFSTKDSYLALKNDQTPEEFLNQRLTEIPPGSEGLMLQPYWKPGLRMPDAKGSIIGFNDGHNRYHIYRAIIEGINYALREGMEKIERKTKQKVERVYVSGGGSQSDAICQITADMFNLPVARGQTYEASGLGAAINAFVGLGIYDSYQQAVEQMVHQKDIFQPQPGNARKYEDLFHQVYKKIYPRLMPLYKAMTNIEQEESNG